jgi:hypothetical protein
MTLRALTFATDIKGRMAGSVMAALTLASIGSAAFALPAAAAGRASAEPVADSIRSGPFSVRHAGQSPAAEARTAKPAVGPRVPPACDSTFHQVTGANPGAAYNAIGNNGMAALSSTDVWAVGGYGQTNAGPDLTLAMKWDGNAWTQVTTPNLGPGNDDLWGVAFVPGAAADISNVWSVGDYTDGGGIEHAQALQLLTANTWTANQPANLGAGNNILFGVAAIAANNVWAVGNWRQSNGNPTAIPPIPASPAQTLIGHWNGTAFTTVAGPQVVPGTSPSSDRLVSVSATGANDVWAVGRSTFSGVSNTLILHYDGTTWSISPSPNPSTTSQTLYSVVAITPMLAYAAGDYTDVSGRHHTLIEKYDGTSWTQVASPDAIPGYDSYLFSLSALSATNIWAGGATYAPNASLTPSYTFAEHYDGTSWKALPGFDGNLGNFNEFNAIVAASPTEIWGGGDYVTTGNILATLTDRLCIPLPTVTGVVPISGNATGGTTVSISGTGFTFATGVKFGATAATSFSINSDGSITATAPAGAAGTVDVTVINAAGTSATSTADTYVFVPPAISWQQYSSAASDGTTWKPIDATNLTLTFTPTAASNVILSGNADLWTSMQGVNQDLGIMLFGGTYGTAPNGTLVGWKESGGNAGTFSPNAAFVQTVKPVAAATAYTATLVWKSNLPTSGTIFAAAGAGPNYSPTRLTAELVPTTNTDLKTVSTNSQYNLAASNGSAWQDLDATNLVITNYSPSASGAALISANADLWTAYAGANQDLGIWITGGTYGTAPNGTIVGWKESGGYAGTFSPNAAYAQTVVQLSMGVQYSIKVQWKANKQTPGTIYAAAGGGPVYSPTRLTVRLFPAGTGLQDAATNSQYNRPGGTGADWMPIDSTNLKLSVVPTANSLYVLSANADLWTANPGINQDIGIFISGGAFGTGTLVAWKESGGYGGTFSPNAAFVETVLPLANGVTYTVTLQWKANKASTGTIYAAAGAGPAPNYSPTRITAQVLS